MPSAQLILPPAHAGHWALWVLYAVPLIVVVWAVVMATVNERRARREEDESAENENRSQ